MERHDRLASILASALLLASVAGCTAGTFGGAPAAPIWTAADPPARVEDPPAANPATGRPTDPPAPDPPAADPASGQAAASACFDRATQPHTSIADAHIHFRPFNGPAIPFDEVVGYLEATGVRFATVMGIGQVLPSFSRCTYYLDCLGTPVTPAFRNDFANATAFAANRPARVRLALSMTFPDLSDPSSILPGIALLDKEFPGMFEWVGEVNLVKQAMYGNHHEAVTADVLDDWAPFMELLHQRDMPLSIHADLGNDDATLMHLPLIERVLRRYPSNKIVWVHMGLSLQLVDMDAAHHVALLERMLADHPNLYLDISWRIVHDHYFVHPEERAFYVPFLNAHSERILTGTDFLASRNKDFETYKEELAVTSSINQHLNDEAFRNIALGQSYARLLNLDYEAPPICAG